MSIRPPYSSTGPAFPSPPNYSVSTNVNPACSLNQNPATLRNAFVPRVYGINKPSQETLASNNFYRNNFMPSQQSVNVSFRSINNDINRMAISAPPSAIVTMPVNQYYPPQSTNFPIEQNYNKIPVNNFESNSNTAMNGSQKGFMYPDQTIGCSNISGDIYNERYKNNPPSISKIVGINDSKTYSSSPQNAIPENMQQNNVLHFQEKNVYPLTVSSGNSENSQSLPAMLPNWTNMVLPQMQSNYTFPFPPPILTNDISHPPVSSNLPKSRKEVKLSEFLNKFSHTKEEKGSKITIPEYRSVLKAAFSLMEQLNKRRRNLINLMEADANKWNSELQTVSDYQKQLSDICSLISAPIHLNAIVKKLKYIKKKRELKKKTKLNKLSQRIEMEKNRKELSQTIDKYLDDIKEKNLKLKREAEMKKEADYILLEVRKKIHEAKRTIEKIKVFEKLRNARQASAVQKGLHILPEHNEKFEKKVICLKETMFKQLADYEAEEKALKVMLEIEQEGQLEEENKWKLKKAKTLQQIKKNQIKQCLFGNSEDPMPTDPLFLFHKYHTSANNSVENLVQIRHQWDVYLSKDGEAVPQQWIAPVPPSNPSWEPWLITSTISKK